MQRRRLRTVRLLHGLGLFLTFCAFAVFFKTSILLLCILGIATLVVPRLSRSRVLVSFWIVMFIVAILPADISFRNRPGPPRFVPYVMGLPGRELTAASRRGEVVLGGCVSTGYEPRWVLVW